MRRFAIIAVILALVSGFLLKGTFLHSMLVLMPGLYLGPPLVLLMTLWFFAGWIRTRRIPRGWQSTFYILIIIGGSLILSLGVGTAVRYWEIREARNYVARMVPQLDAYRNTQGHYPKTLADLKAPSAPALLQSAYCYTAEPDSFTFEYVDPGGMMDGYYFDSVTRKWNYFDIMDGH